MKKYSQAKAMLAISKASLRSLLRSPSAVVFGFAFPFVFILVFGFIGNNGAMRKYKVAIDSQSDTSNVVYRALQQHGNLVLKHYTDSTKLSADEEEGRIAGILLLKKNVTGDPPFTIRLQSTTSSNDQWPQVTAILQSIINSVSDTLYKERPAVAQFDFDMQRDVKVIRQYKTIDFILPGQLGFSLLASGVFGVAFTFFSLRNTLVLKRFFATPISRTHIILGEMISRVLFQLVTAVVIILAGKYFFGFTLIHGFSTFLQMIVLSFIGLTVFMGFGFIVSGLAKNESTIPPFANLITLPQFLIGGTFFSIEVFPQWLQWIARLMPLTHLNEALRQVAFEGKDLWDVKTEIGILLLWGIVVYTIAVKVFKWES